MAEAILAVLLQEPHLGGPRVGGRFLRDDELYRRIFDPTIPLTDFFKALEVVRRIESILRSVRLDGDAIVARARNSWPGRYVLFVSMATVLDATRGAPISDLDPDSITHESVLSWVKFIRESENSLPKGRRNEAHAEAALRDMVFTELQSRHISVNSYPYGVSFPLR
jgi:hypothetical protein